MTKNYQKIEFDTRAPAGEMAVPERVSVAMGEIAADLQRGAARAWRLAPACR